MFRAIYSLISIAWIYHLSERKISMTGSIQTKKGRANYYAVLNVYDDNGKRKQKWIDTEIPVKGNNKRKADAKLKELLAEYSTNGVNLNRDVLFISFMEQWLETMKVSISSSTHHGYVKIFKTNICPYFERKKLKLSELTPMHIQQYVNDKVVYLSPNTVTKHLVNMSKCLKSAVKQSIIPFNPVDRIEKPKVIRYMGAKFYNENQIEQLIEHSKEDPLEIVILLAVFYGLRRSEVLGLKWSAIDFANKTISIKHTVVKTDNVIHKRDRTKNDASNATFPMPDRIISALKQWQTRQLGLKALQPKDFPEIEYVCTYDDGRLLSPDYISQHFVILLNKIGLPRIRFHDLRHSSASYLKYLGFDLKDIQVWLRHKDIQTTLNLYTHLDMAAKENIANSINARLQVLQPPGNGLNQPSKNVLE